jgi:hypothetical protein
MRNVILSRALGAIAVMAVTGCGPDISKLEREFGERLPQGTPALHVVAFLDERHVEHSVFSLPKEPGVLRSIVRDTSPFNLLVKTSYQVVFSFDANDRLQKHETNKQYTGL